MEDVLIVSNNHALLGDAKAFLTGEPFRLVVETNVDGASGYLAKRAVGAVMVDEDVDGGDAMAFLTKLYQTRPAVTRLFSATTLETHTAQAAINDARVYKVVPKPWRPRQVADVLNQAIRHYRAECLRDRIFALVQRSGTLITDIEREARASGVPAPGDRVPRFDGEAAAPLTDPDGDDLDPLIRMSRRTRALLSPREGDVLRALIVGDRADAAARTFGVSVHTVRNQIKAIYRKLGVNSRAECMARVLGAK